MEEALPISGFVFDAPVTLLTSPPLLRSQTLTCGLSLPTARFFQSGLKHRDLTACDPFGPAIWLTNFPLLVSQSFRVSSSCPRRILLSVLKAKTFSPELSTPSLYIMRPVAVSHIFAPTAINFPSGLTRRREPS